MDQIDYLIESEKGPLPLEDPPPGDAERAIAEHASHFIADGATLQTGIGAIPSTIAGLLADGDGGDYGVHSEMFTHRPHAAARGGEDHESQGAVRRRLGRDVRRGHQELYEWLDGNPDVAFLPVEIVNSPDVIARNRRMVTINGALMVDVQGQVIADTINANQFSGIGGHEDFVSGPALALDAASLLCMSSTYTAGSAATRGSCPGSTPGR